MKEEHIDLISCRDQFAAKLDFPKSFVNRLYEEKWKGLAAGGIIAAIAFIGLSLSYLTYGIIFTATVLVFSPAWVPALIALIVGGATSTVIFALLSKYLPSKKIIIERSFESKLDELAAAVFTLVFVPSIGVLLFDKKSMDKKNKAMARESLIDWGYNPLWIDSELDKAFNGKPKIRAVFCSLIWKSYRKECKKRSNSDKKTAALKKDIPDPDKLKNRMLEIINDFAPSPSKKQQDYISALEKF